MDAFILLAEVEQGHPVSCVVEDGYVLVLNYVRTDAFQ